jgi:hypothetical protein
MKNSIFFISVFLFHNTWNSIENEEWINGKNKKLDQVYTNGIPTHSYTNTTEHSEPTTSFWEFRQIPTVSIKSHQETELKTWIKYFFVHDFFVVAFLLTSSWVFLLFGLFLVSELFGNTVLKRETRPFCSVLSGKQRGSLFAPRRIEVFCYDCISRWTKALSYNIDMHEATV